MSTTRLARAGVLAFALVLVGCTAVPEATIRPAGSPAATASGAAGGISAPGDGVGPAASPTPVPAPGHELYGFMPYWEMDDPGMADHVASLPLTTLALFSVTHTPKGAIDTKARAYSWLTGDVGRGLVTSEHARGGRVEVVYTSFGAARNTRLFQNAALQASVVASLVALVRDMGVDGVNVDIEGLDPALVPAYGAFVGSLRTALRAEGPSLTVSVATGGHALGAAMAVVAAQAGADRIFLMGYDYRVASSEPGATAPLDRSDGNPATLRNSLALYSVLGVPADRLLLGLPLYGIEWPVAGPVIGAPSTGKGAVWFPRAHTDLLTNPSIVPLRDPVEQVDVYFTSSDGLTAPPSVTPSSPPAPPNRTWDAVYVDTPGTLAPKLDLANQNGLAGAGFWAVGYTRGLQAYTDLMTAFTKGDPLP